MFKLITPTTENQLNKYYHFRWQMLREPWRMPVGSERDEYDGMSHHRMIVDGRGRPMAIGRLYITPDLEGQIRYMAVKNSRWCFEGSILLSRKKHWNWFVKVLRKPWLKCLIPKRSGMWM